MIRRAGVRALLRDYWPWLIALLVWGVLIAKAVRELGDGNDFTILYDAARRVLGGEQLYAAGSAYMYPPPFACLLAPLALFPCMVAGIVFAVGKVPLFHYAAAAFLARVQFGAELPPSRRRALIALSPLLVFRFLESDLATGNTNVYILAGIAAAVACAARGRATVAGVLLGIVSTVKLAPLYLAAVLAAARRLQTGIVQCAVAAALIAVCAALLPGGIAAARRGFLENSEAVRDTPPAREDDAQRGYLPGQSLRPFFHRWLSDSDATAHDQARVTLNLVSLEPEQVEWLYRILATCIACAALFAVRGRNMRWSIAGGVVVMLLVSPYSRKAHFVLLLPALLLVVEAMLRSGMRARRGVLAWFALSLALAQLTTPAIAGRGNASWLLGAGVVGLSALAILPAMWMIRGEHDAS